MKKIIKTAYRQNRKLNNVNLMLISKKAKIFNISFFFIIFFIISYTLLLFFNIQYAYAIKDKELKITQHQNSASVLESEYLIKLVDVEKNIDSDRYVSSQKVVYLDNNLNKVAFNTKF